MCEAFEERAHRSVFICGQISFQRLEALAMSSAGLHSEIAAWPAPIRGTMRLGSWTVRLAASRDVYVENLELLFRQRVSDSPIDGGNVDVDLRLLSCPRDDPTFTLGKPIDDGATAEWETLADGTRTLSTGRFRVFVDADRAPLAVTILIREPQYSARGLRDHLFEVICKILFAFDRFYVHAGAVEWRGRVNVFVGRGSFGKSTVCLRLAMAGATVLSEDHVLFRREGRDFRLSGCQETARVTAKTERFVFRRELAIPSQTHTGVAKKEIRVADHFACRPYVDVPFHRIFFNRIGETFRIEPINGRDAMLRLLYMTRSFFRFSDAGDLDRYLDYFADLVAGRACYELELAPDLGELDRLVEFLDERDAAGR